MDLHRAREDVAEPVELLRDMNQMIVDIPKINRVLLANEVKIVARELIEHLPLRPNRAAHVDQRALEGEQPV